MLIGWYLTKDFFFFNNFIYLFLAVLDLRCWMWAFAGYGEQGLHIPVVSLVAEYGL